jgi:hypothetical protein
MLSQKSNNNNFSNSIRGSNLPKIKSVFDSIDTKQIGEGKYFTEGKFGHKRNLGLKGQLSKLKRNGRLVTKNLSKKNLGDMYNLIANRLKKHNMGYGVHINRKDKVGIMQEAEKLVRTKDSKFSREDKADLESIVDVLKEKSKNSILEKRYLNVEDEKKQDSPSDNKGGKYFSNEHSHLKNSVKSSNIKQDIYQLDNNDRVLDLEDRPVTFKPLEQDNEIEELRKQAKDLVI